MTGRAIRLVLPTAAALAIAACGGSPQQEKPATPAVEVKSPPPVAASALTMTITFKDPIDPKIKADCQAWLSGGNDTADAKNEKVTNGDTVTWTIVNDKCAKYKATTLVELHFHEHVFKDDNGGTGGDKYDLDNKKSPTQMMGTVEAKGNTGDVKHPYEIKYDHKDAGDPDVDVNDPNGPTVPPALAPEKK